MQLNKRRIISASIILVAIFSVISGVLVTGVSAGGWTLGPVNVAGTATTGQNVTVIVPFKAATGSANNYLLDTEVYNATGTKVAQWYETMWMGSDQSLSRTYQWNTAGLPAGTYTFQQGVFNANWNGALGWNSTAGKINLTTGAVQPAPSPTPPTATAAPVQVTTAAATSGWNAGATLLNNSAVINTNATVAASFSVAQSGTYNLDVEIYNASGTRVKQCVETRTINPGAAQSMNCTWVPDVATGYKARLGIFNTAWQVSFWNDNALNFQATSSGQPNSAPISTPTPTPAPVSAPVSSSGFMRGVNLASAEFGETRLPGVYGIDYIYPGARELDYYKSKGLTLVRLPFLWERLQRSLYAPLDATELGQIDTFIGLARSRGMKVILDPHNYARYTLGGVKYLIGSSQVPHAAFADFWTKLAARYKNEATIVAYSLMNEPNNTGGTWKAAAQAGLNGVRQSDMAKLVMVPGDQWSGAWTWMQHSANLILTDPANNLMYEAHQYFDRDGSGTYPESYDASGAYANIGVDRIQPFINWLKANNLRGIVTEYGVPNNDQRWLTVLDNFLAKLDAEGIGGTYWAGGPWWGNYILSSEPRNGADAPVMNVLSKHPGR